MTLDDDDDDLPPQPRPPDDTTPYGRIWGRDKRRYARLWGVDLDRPASDDCPSGEEEFRTTYLLMSMDHSAAEDQTFGPIGSRAFGGGKVLPDGTYRPRHPFDDHLDEEEFAAAWRPPTMSEMIEEEIERREEEARRRRDQDPEVRH
jgi:hypothetical protein